MKKKRAIRNYVLATIFIVLTLVLTFVSFPVVGTNYNFLGLGNLQLGLELGGGVKNTYDLEVADWYTGSKESAYKTAVDRVQYLLNEDYADAKVYLNSDDKITIEVPATSINSNYVVGFLEMKSESGADAEVKVNGHDIESVKYMLSGTTHGVYIEFNKEGKKKFADLTEAVSNSSDQTMYIYMNKDYDNPFSSPKVTEKNDYGYTFISGAGITDKKSGQSYARKIESALIGVNMSTDLDDIEVGAIFGEHTRLGMTIVTIAVVLASIILAFILFKQLGLVSCLSVLFALMVSVVIAAFADLQVTFAGWLGFLFGYVLNYGLHLYYLYVIKREYAMGKKFLVSFTSGYRGALFNILDTLLIVTGTILLLLIVPSSAIRMFTFNYLITLAGTAFTALWLNKVFAVDYTAFNLKNEKKVNFVREESVDEIA